MTPCDLKAVVLAQLATFAEEYSAPPPHDGFGGRPWSKERVCAEIEKMRPFLIEPRKAEYFCEDDRQVSDPPSTLLRKAWSVAVDPVNGYELLFDEEAGNFVLVERAERGLVSWGIRGNAAECFISR